MATLLPHLGRATAAPVQTLDSAEAAVMATEEVQAPNPLPVVTVSQPEPTSTPVADQPQAAAPAGNATPLEGSGARPVEEAAPADEELRNFVTSVRNDQQGTVAGIYVPGLFGMPVTGQPGGEESYISSDDNVLTQYGKPAEFGVTALLAHNYLNSGKSLGKLKPQQEIYLVYGDGKVSRYQVTSVEYYQALSPHDVRSDFRDLNGPNGSILSFSQLFDRVYTTPNRLVFQTCLEANGELSWGRVFISADLIG